MPIVVIHEASDRPFEMLLIQNQQRVETLRPNGSYEALGDSIRLRRSKWRAHDLNLLRPKYLIEARGELLIPVSDQKADGFRPIRECPRELTGLLRHPGRRRRRRAASQMDSAAPQLNEEEHVQPLQPDRLHREEIDGEEALTMRADELTPCHPVPRADRSNARVPQPRADSRGGDGNAKPFQLADDSLVTPSWVLTSETDCELPDVRPNRPTTASARIRPAFRDQPSVPSQQRRGRNQERVPTKAREQATGSQEEPVDVRDRGPADPTAQDREFVSQDQDLEILEVIRPSVQGQQLQDMPKRDVAEGEKQRGLRVAGYSKRLRPWLKVRFVRQPRDSFVEPFTAPKSQTCAALSRSIKESGC
jgi:hypothetical protein